jgi:hypothetical protein
MGSANIKEETQFLAAQCSVHFSTLKEKCPENESLRKETLSKRIIF